MQEKSNTYLPKGIPYGKIVSFLNFLALFTLLPSFLRLVWPALISYLSGIKIHMKDPKCTYFLFFLSVLSSWVYTM